MNAPKSPTMNAQKSSTMQPPHISASAASAPISFGQSVKEGFGLGIGSAIGHRIIASLFASPPPSPPSPPSPCAAQQTTFDTCIKEQKEVRICQEHLDALHKCFEQSVQR